MFDFAFIRLCRTYLSRIKSPVIRESHIYFGLLPTTLCSQQYTCWEVKQNGFTQCTASTDEPLVPNAVQGDKGCAPEPNS